MFSRGRRRAGRRRRSGIPQDFPDDTKRYDDIVRTANIDTQPMIAGKPLPHSAARSICNRTADATHQSGRPERIFPPRK
jgi:hypothetical protein